MNAEQKQFLDEATKSMTDAVEKALPEVVDKVVSQKVAELSEKSAKDIEDVKSELKKMNLAGKATNKEAKELAQKTFVVSVFKEVMKNGIKSEEAFKEVSKKVYAGMGEGSWLEGEELVFDQFETDILRVINTYDILNDVRILPLAKGDKVSLPKATNGITTYRATEAGAKTGSKPATSFVVIDIAKASTFTDMTEELLDDTMTTPDLYNLIVEFIGESQANFLETEVLTGTGSVKGILVNASVNKVYLGTGNTAEDIDDANIVDVITKAGKKYKRNKAKVKWYMSQYVFGKLRSLITTDGFPLYPTLRDANPTLEGSAVVISDCGFVQNISEDIAEGICLLYGDLSYFTLAKRKGVTVERGYYGDNWVSDIQTIKSNQRVGGACTFPEALTILVNWAMPS